MFNFKDFFEQKKRNNALYKIETDSCVDFYCGFDENNQFCLALKAESSFPIITSTKLLNIEQKIDVIPNTHWMYISLTNVDAKNVFFSFCFDIFELVKEQTKFDDLYILIKNRINCWKKMFAKVHKPLSKEIIKGLFGELFFINTCLSTKIGISEAIKSWSGPLGTSKDFAYHEKWFEIKTISTSQPVVKISSLTQLSDDKDGFLVVIKIEDTSEMYVSNSSDVITIYEEICKKIRVLNDDQVAESFFEKMNKLGFAPDDQYKNIKFKIKELVYYLVNDRFPRIKECDIPHQEIARVSYEIILNTIESFRSEPWNQ